MVKKGYLYKCDRCGKEELFEIMFMEGEGEPGRWSTLSNVRSEDAEDDEYTHLCPECSTKYFEIFDKFIKGEEIKTDACIDQLTVWKNRSERYRYLILDLIRPTSNIQKRINELWEEGILEPGDVLHLNGYKTGAEYEM